MTISRHPKKANPGALPVLNSIRVEADFGAASRVIHTLYLGKNVRLELRQGICALSSIVPSYRLGVYALGAEIVLFTERPSREKRPLTVYRG